MLIHKLYLDRDSSQPSTASFKSSQIRSKAAITGFSGQDLQVGPTNSETRSYFALWLKRRCGKKKPPLFLQNQILVLLLHLRNSTDTTTGFMQEGNLTENPHCETVTTCTGSCRVLPKSTVFTASIKMTSPILQNVGYVNISHKLLSYASWLHCSFKERLTNSEMYWLRSGLKYTQCHSKAAEICRQWYLILSRQITVSLFKKKIKIKSPCFYSG